MTTLRLVLGDQISPAVSALAGLDPARDTVLMMEVADECTHVAHHKQKIVLVLSAMRHFASELGQRGVRIDYVRLDDPSNTGGFAGEVERAVARRQPDRILVTEPGQWRVQAIVESWRDRFGRPVEILFQLLSRSQGAESAKLD
jgi:deoxyribodipyrimidine photolyase-related protein